MELDMDTRTGDVLRNLRGYTQTNDRVASQSFQIRM